MAKGEIGIGQGVVAAVFAGGIFFGLRTLTQRPSESSTPSSPPPKIVTEFRLLASNSSLTKLADPSMPVPVVEYEIEGPPAELETVRAEIIGDDQRRLALTPTGPTTMSLQVPTAYPTPAGGTAETPVRWSRRRFVLSGYAFAPRSPKLVLSRMGKTVFSTPVPPLSPPLKAIPFVVPLQEESALVPLKGFKHPEGSYLASYTYHWRLSTPRPEDWGTDPLLVRTEWPGASGAHFPLEGKGHGFGFEKTTMGGIAEIRTTESMVRTERKEATVPIEIYDDGKQAGLRVLEPVTLEFSDGGRVEFLAQERRIARDRNGKLRGQAVLPAAIYPGSAGLILAPAFVSTPSFGLPGSPTLATVPPHPVALPRRPPSNRIEFLSPTLAELGLSRVEWASEETSAKPTGPVATGRFQARIRITHAMGVNSVRSRFVRIEPQS